MQARASAQDRIWTPLFEEADFLLMKKSPHTSKSLGDKAVDLQTAQRLYEPLPVGEKRTKHGLLIELRGVGAGGLFFSGQVQDSGNQALVRLRSLRVHSVAISAG
jgi:hypothetical protein